MMDCTDKHEIQFLSLISKNVHLYTEMIVANASQARGNRDKLLSFKNFKSRGIQQILVKFLKIMATRNLFRLSK